MSSRNIVLTNEEATETMQSSDEKLHEESGDKETRKLIGENADIANITDSE